MCIGIWTILRIYRFPLDRLKWSCRIFVPMAIVHDDVSSIIKEVSKCISQESLLCSLICEVGGSNDGYLMSPMWDI